MIKQDMAITSQKLARFIGVPDPSHDTVAAQRALQKIKRWHETGRKRSSNDDATSTVLPASTAAILRAFYQEDERQLAFMY